NDIKSDFLNNNYKNSNSKNKNSVYESIKNTMLNVETDVEETVINNEQATKNGIFITVEDLSQRWNTGKNQVYNLIHSGILPAKKHKGKWLILFNDVLKYEDEQEEIQRKQEKLMNTIIYGAIGFTILLIIIMLL
ncbi:MAG: helix-turn-helix domain-containing protein, partial [Clostridia bacterium]|nr:helix-turn-helix domain-containing protein [Clostridia bacterium]